MLGLLESSGIAIEGDYYTYNISNHQYIIAIIVSMKILLGINLIIFLIYRFTACIPHAPAHCMCT